MSLSLSKKLGKRLRDLRQERGYTQEQAAKRCRMEYKYYQRYEGNNPRDMRLSTIEKLAEGFDVPLWKLMKFDE